MRSKSVSHPTTAPLDTAEPATDPAPAAPPQGVLSSLGAFKPNRDTELYSASMGRLTATMIRHASERIGEAIHMLEQLAFDATVARDFDSVEFLTTTIAKLK